MRRRGIARNSALALAGDVSSKLGLLLVMVIAARAMTTGEFAVLGTALAVSGIVAVTLDAGAGLLITRDGARAEAVRGGLFVALGLARAPLAVLVVAAGIAAGIVLGKPAVCVAAVLVGLLGAAGSSLIGLFRAGQDMRPEAAQKLLYAGLALAATTVAVAVSPTAEGLLVGLLLAGAISMTPLVLLARRPLHAREHRRRLPSLARALPLGLMAIATVVYYRSGTVGLAVLSTPQETASFTVASAVGFGLLMLPNAITTGLLPHLAAEEGGSPHVTTRRALGWSVALSAPVAATAALCGYLLLGPVFGPAYQDAALPLALLCVAVCLIAYNGILGTALLAAGHVGTIGFQVACSLAVNIAALWLLIPPFGAAGAAGATLLCEVVALGILTAASVRRLPGLVLVPRTALPTA